MTSKLKTESDLKSELVKASRAFGDYARRLEDKYTVGMPDILYGPKASPVTFLIEAKLIEGPTFGPTPRQLYELDMWTNSSSLINPERQGLVLGFKDGLFYLHYPRSIVKVSDCFVSDPGEPFHLFIRRYNK